MSQLQVLKSALDALGAEPWAEMVAQFGIPVALGEPAIVEFDGIEWAVFDDPRLTEEHALAVIGAFDE